ncbi:MAG TPA: hypothetical protein VMZ50_02080 [Phycisphaerae bacterium]|nr:hypothetical protein [Phycisphaerae bacterium]
MTCRPLRAAWRRCRLAGVRRRRREARRAAFLAWVLDATGRMAGNPTDAERAAVRRRLHALRREPIARRR